MPPVCRTLQHREGPRQRLDRPGDPHENQPYFEITERGLCLIHIEFLLHNLEPTCIITSPVRHIGVLAYLFPRIQFVVYRSDPGDVGEHHNVSKVAAEFSERHATPGQFSLVFTTENDPRQLACSAKTKPSSILFSMLDIPTDHVDGVLFLPICSTPRSTAVFLHSSSKFLGRCVAYDTKILGEELCAFGHRPPGYDQDAAQMIIQEAVQRKLRLDGIPPDPLLTSVVVDLVHLLLVD